MKLPSKPISSPGRAEKFPPPLMRFLRSNVGSRSRGRSRSSPMFVRKKSSSRTTTTIETQEPSSPKVTCIGQVRVRRSKQTASKPGPKRTPIKRRCRWVRKALFCHHFGGKLKPKSFRPVWRKWVSFFQLGYRRKVEINEDSSKIESKCENKDHETDPEDQNDDVEEQEQEQARVYVAPSPSSPPKNALLLTRCRSAPYRSSSLASRFWGLEETGEEQRTEQVAESRDQRIENEGSTSENEPICRDSSAGSRTDSETEDNLGTCKEFEGSINERSIKSPKIEALKTGEGDSVRPLILTRCKSEPARTAEKKVGFC